MVKKNYLLSKHFSKCQFSKEEEEPKTCVTFEQCDLINSQLVVEGTSQQHQQLLCKSETLEKNLITLMICCKLKA